MELGIIWPPTWLELNLIKFKFLPNSSEVFHRLPTQANSCLVVLLFLCDYAVVVRQLNGSLRAGSTWQQCLATRRCKFWFCNLAQVGLSWENHLGRTCIGNSTVAIANPKDTRTYKGGVRVTDVLTRVSWSEGNWCLVRLWALHSVWFSKIVRAITLMKD